jgi:antigen flippase
MRFPALLFGQMLPATASAGTVVLTARLLGPVGRGEIAFVLTAVSITCVISTCGLYVQVASAPADHEGRIGVDAATALMLSNAVITIPMLILAVTRTTLGTIQPMLTFVIACGSFLSSVTLFGQRVLQARVPGNRFLHVSAVQSLAILASALILLRLPTVSAFFVTWLAGQCVTVVFVISLIGHDAVFDTSHVRADPLSGALQAIRTAMPVAGGLTVQILVWRTDSVVLGLVSGAAAVGLYSLAVAASSVIWLPAEALTLSLYREAATLGASSDQFLLRLRSLTRLCAAATGLAAGVIFIVFAVCVNKYLPAFRSSVPLLLILCVGVVPAAVGRLLFAAAGLRQQRDLLWRFTAIGLTLCLLYVPACRWGGAAGAASVSVVIYVIVAYLFRSALGPSRTESVAA